MVWPTLGSRKAKEQNRNRSILVKLFVEEPTVFV